MRLKPTFVQETIASPTQIGYGPGAICVYNYDLTQDFGAWLFLRMARNFAFTPVAGLRFEAKPGQSALDSQARHPAGPIVRMANRNANVYAPANVADAAAGIYQIQPSAGGFANGDQIIIFGPSGERVEWKRVSNYTGGVLYTDTAMQYTHLAATADNVVSGADIFPPVWLPGATNYYLTFDNQAESAGGYWFALDASRQTDLKTYPG